MLNENEKYLNQGTLSKIKGEIKTGILIFIFSKLMGGFFILIFAPVWIPIVWLTEKYYLSSLQPTDGDREVAYYNSLASQQQSQVASAEEERQRIYKEKYNETLRRMKGNV